MITKKEIIDIVDRYWKFDEYQQHAASWHDKQDCLKELENKLSGGVLFDEATVDGILFKIKIGACDNCDAATWNDYDECTRYKEGKCLLDDGLIYINK